MTFKLRTLTVLALIWVFVVACGGGDSAPAADTQSADSDQATEAQETTAEETTAEETTEEASEETTTAPVMETVLVGDLEGPTIITDQTPASFGEAPMLAEMVAAGELPPVEERLPNPEDVLVIQPVHEIGKYGGTWKRGFTGPADGQNGHRVAGGDRFVFWDAVNFPEVVPNLAKAWEVSEDGTTITVSLRDGAKWSDGQPFTADDVLFWYEHMYQNEELVPVPSPFFNPSEGASLEKIDDLTVQFSFPSPNSLFLEVLGSSVNVFGGHAIFGATAMGGFAPAHYLEQFHPTFVDADELNALAEEEGFDGWVTMFKDKNTWQRNPDLPVMTPWMTEVPITTPNWVLVRNPYYYGVDTEGNQLPYIDRISMNLAENLEVLNLRAIAGEYDYQARHVSLANLPVLLENADEVGYTVYLDPAQHGADGAFQFNLSYEADAYIGDLIRTTDFRRALSLAVDRDQINEIIFLGVGVPGSAVVAESSIFSPGPEWRDKWSVRDVDQANAMLDELGLTERDSEGFRLRTDNGERLIIELPAVPAFIQFTQLSELVKEDWADIGIFANVVEQERGLVMTRRGNNDLPIFVWQNDGTDELFTYPYHAIPVTSVSGTGPAYGIWFASGGEGGIEPTDESVLQVQQMFKDGLLATPEERVELAQEIWKIITDEVWTMGTVGQSGAFMGVRVVKNNLGNIPSRQLNIQAGQTPNISRPSTFFFTDAGE